MGSVNGDVSSPRETSADEEKIFVSVRLRPLNEKELSKNDVSDWECINNTTILYKNVLQERSMFPTACSFDRVFGSECSTRQVYEEAAKKVALSVVSGINSSIFAYGQTSSGKTYTMSGITEYAVSDIYEYINKHEDRKFALKFSAMEIYNECVRDLLGSDNTQLRLLDDPERGTVVEKLSEVTLRDFNHLKELLSVCEAQRQIGETSLNETSSRSHQILRLTVESSARKFLGSQNSSTLAATVDFVDLAGSERASQTLSVSTRLKEGCHINRSLLTLGTVIRKLSKGRNGHVPYRDSKLTRILQNSLGGNARTAIICTVSPAHSHVEQSRNTLLFASCAKQVSTNAHVNVVMSEKALVKQLQKELARLENELRTLASLSRSTDSTSALKEKELLIQKMDKEMRELARQRDIAHSCLQDMLQSAGEYQRSRSWAEMSNFSESHERGSWIDDYPTSEASEIVDPLHIPVNVSQFSDRYEAFDSSKDDVQFPESEDQFLSDDTSPTKFIDKYFGPDPSRGWEKMAHTTDQNVEDICKEVQCIEIDVDKNTKSSEMVSPQENECQDSGPISADEKDGTLKQNAQELKESSDVEQSPPSSETDLTDSRSIEMSRSRSCVAILANMSSPPEQEMVKDKENVPPSVIEENNPEKFKGDELKVSELGHGDNHVDAKDEKTKISSEEAIDSKHSCGTDFQEDDKPKSQKPSGDDQVLEVEPVSKLEEFSDDGLKTDDDLPQQSPSDWSMEFEKRRREIIELWDACNISLVHRTYFFLLFKGEPSDFIYMEVELRQLSYLKITLSRGTSVVKNDKTLTQASSAKALNREREMLTKQMLKKFSSKEREDLFQKWGIGLKTKQRRLQLCRKLWTDTKDMEHIKESAALVGKLVGIVGPSDAPKEIFGLSLPHPTTTRSYSWKPSLHL